MSFTSEIKDELFEKQNTKIHCMTAELSAYINTLSAFDTTKDKRELLFVSDDIRHSERISFLIKTLFDIEVNAEKYNSTYILRLKDPGVIIKMLTATGASFGLYSDSSINPYIIRRSCCKKAYLRTAFLINGFVTDPVKNYHMEFAEREYAHAYGLKTIINDMGISAKITERKNRFVVYIKDSEQISDLLNIMSAHLSLLRLENIKVYKEVRNNINRKINCETSNLKKTITASVREQNAIQALMENGRYKELPPKLKAVAELRLNNPDLSYQELGKLLEPNLGKSGVYHRLQKIIQIAENAT